MKNFPGTVPRNPLILHNEVFKRLERKESEVFAKLARQHTTDELKTVVKTAGYLSEHGISALAELDSAFFSVSGQAGSLREGIETAEKCMKELQKLIEYTKNYTGCKLIRDKLKKL